MSYCSLLTKPDAQRGYDSDSEADGATTDADVAVPASSFQLPGSAQTQTLAPPLLRRDSAAQTAQLAAGRTSDSRQDVASEQPQLTAQPALWLSQGFGAFGGGLQQQQMQSVAAAEYCHPSAPLFQQVTGWRLFRADCRKGLCDSYCACLNARGAS